mmetsp:Transcript_19563/g.36829  ORF Transcript_19563/g.36829 Transcript_19563/m.36829 type:complete len:251 (-) Transcript_19563:81-833(-)
MGGGGASPPAPRLRSQPSVAEEGAGGCCLEPDSDSAGVGGGGGRWGSAAAATAAAPSTTKKKNPVASTGAAGTRANNERNIANTSWSYTPSGAAGAAGAAVGSRKVLYKTQLVRGRDGNYIWNLYGEKGAWFEYDVHNSDLALLLVEVLQEPKLGIEFNQEGSVISQAAVLVRHLLPGIRSVPLYDPHNHPTLAHLMCQIEVDHRGHSVEDDVFDTPRNPLERFDNTEHCSEVAGMMFRERVGKKTCTIL